MSISLTIRSRGDILAAMFCTIIEPVLSRNANKGSVSVFVPDPSASGDAVRISCRTSEAPMKVDSFERSCMRTGMTPVISLMR